MAVTDKEILDVVTGSHRPMKAREIATRLSSQKQLSITRSDVNRILYRLKSEGKVCVDDQFEWRLVQAPDNREHKQSAQNSQSKPGGHSTTHYDVLQVSPNADPRVIEKAYKVLVGLYHPDRAAPHERKEFEERMKLLNIAYDVLSDSRKRKEYDAMLEQKAP